MQRTLSIISSHKGEKLGKMVKFLGNLTIISRYFIIELGWNPSHWVSINQIAVHCVRSVKIRRFFLVHFFPYPHSVSTNAVKYAPKKTSYLNAFHAVVLSAYITEMYLEPSRTYTMKIFCENNWRLLAFNYSRKKAPSQMIDWVLDSPLPRSTEVHMIPT